MDDLISYLDLFYVPSIKGSYTWNNKMVGPGNIALTLDQFLINNYFLTILENVSSSILPWGGSDHHPITLTFVREINWGPIPFTFNSLRMDHLDFFPLVSHSWCQWVSGSPAHIWEKKLKITKVALKSW